MAKRILKDELAAIIHAVSLFPKGASIKDIRMSLESPPPQRTLQYRLSFLIKTGQLKAEGKARSRRYWLFIKKSEKAIGIQNIEFSIPLSNKSKFIQEAITRPLHTRHFVSYNRKFLDKYQPNVTYYLPESLRQKLLKLGKTDGKRPAGTYARQIFNRLLIDLSWNSSRLEGNTYSLLETERLLELGKASDKKDIKETQMILNHKAAIEFIVESAENIGINRYTLLNLHALLANDLLFDSRSCGAIRSIPVAISKTVYQPLAIPQLVNECFDQLIKTAYDIKNPFEQAFFLMVQLPYLQPFEDVNKRVSRLAANLPLIKANLCPLSPCVSILVAFLAKLKGVYIYAKNADKVFKRV
ncbi:MAG: Fic family protein [Chlamydiae bacterium]|nr:Fic family protein [Chlamydiota bacterium]